MDKKIKNYILVFIAFIINVFIVLVFPFECPWKKNLGIDCAGCGATRMIRSIFKLDFYQAFRYNPLIFILLILFIIYLIYILICKIIKKNFYIFNEKWLGILLFILISFTILRNIGMFGFLKPTLIR